MGERACRIDRADGNRARLNCFARRGDDVGFVSTLCPGEHEVQTHGKPVYLERIVRKLRSCHGSCVNLYEQVACDLNIRVFKERLHREVGGCDGDAARHREGAHLYFDVVYAGPAALHAAGKHSKRAVLNTHVERGENRHVLADFDLYAVDECLLRAGKRRIQAVDCRCAAADGDRKRLKAAPRLGGTERLNG